MEPRIKTGLRIQAAIRLCDRSAVPVAVVRRGDPDAGSILIKLSLGEGRCTVLAQARTMTGELAWMRGTGTEPVDEPTADAYLERQIKRDPDVWVIAIEDRQGRHFFDGRVL